MAILSRATETSRREVARLRDVEKEATRLKLEAASLGQTIEQCNASIESLKDSAASLRAALEDVTAALTASTQQRAHLERRVAELLPKALQAEQSENHNAILRAGLLSKFQMLSSEVGIFRRIREGALPGIRQPETLRLLYLDLLEQALTNTLYGDPPQNPGLKDYDADVRLRGWDWPSQAHTMIGRARLRHLRELVEEVLAHDVKGDFLEAGVWRGGATILMRGLLAAYDVPDRKVWVADSFAGLPSPDEGQYPADKGDPHHTLTQLAVSIEEVKGNFEKYNLLDDQVRFLEGWFKDTLPAAPIDRLAILRLDGDMYGSTMDTLRALYAKVSRGGYVIVDDYILPPCRQAVSDFRGTCGIEDEIREVDGAAVYWQVSQP